MATAVARLPGGMDRVSPAQDKCATIRDDAQDEDSREDGYLDSASSPAYESISHDELMGPSPSGGVTPATGLSASTDVDFAFSPDRLDETQDKSQHSSEEREEEEEEEEEIANNSNINNDDDDDSMVNQNFLRPADTVGVSLDTGAVASWVARNRHNSCQD